MAQRTVSRLYDSYQDASDVVRDLENAGIAHSEISLLGPSAQNAATSGDMNDTTETDSTTGAGAGATVGTVIGGGAGLLAGLGSLAIPGVGPIVAAGWLIATLTGAGAGAAAGGLLGALTGAGVEEEHAHTMAEGVRRGSSLVTVRVADDTRAAEVEAIMDRRNPVDPAVRRTDYQAEGWNRFDPAGAPYTSEAVDLPGGMPRRDRIQVP